MTHQQDTFKANFTTFGIKTVKNTFRKGILNFKIPLIE